MNAYEFALLVRLISKLRMVLMNRTVRWRILSIKKARLHNLAFKKMVPGSGQICREQICTALAARRVKTKDGFDESNGSMANFKHKKSQTLQSGF